MTDPDETANLVGEITRAYREHAAEEPKITAVPGRVLGSDIEGHADALADDAGRLAALLTEFAKEPGPRSIDAIAVFRGLSHAAGQMAAAAAELRRQEWSVLRMTPSQRPRPPGMAPWKACGPPLAPSSGSLLAGSE